MTLNAKMTKVGNTDAPYLNATITDKNGKQRLGLMLVDSCCTHSNLFSDAVTGMDFRSPGYLPDNLEVFGVANGSQTMSCVSAEIEIGGNKFVTDFTVGKRNYEQSEEDTPVIGIIGVDFLLLNKLVIDYASRTVHKSSITPSNFSVEQCDYIFRMELGLKHYGMPVIPVKGTDFQHAAIIDSGADCCFISAKALEKVSDNVHLSDWMQESFGVAGRQINRLATIGFTIQGWDADHQDCLHDYHHESLFQIVKEDCLYTTDDNPENPSIQPIDIIIGASFLALHKWAIDFGAQLIYKRRVPLSA